MDNNSSETTGEEDLFKAIQSRQSSRAAQQNNFLEKLAEKYNTKPTKGSKKADEKSSTKPTKGRKK